MHHWEFLPVAIQKFCWIVPHGRNICYSVSDHLIQTTVFHWALCFDCSFWMILLLDDQNRWAYESLFDKGYTNKMLIWPVNNLIRQEIPFELFCSRLKCLRLKWKLLNIGISKLHLINFWTEKGLKWSNRLIKYWKSILIQLLTCRKSTNWWIWTNSFAKHHHCTDFRLSNERTANVGND